MKNNADVTLLRTQRLVLRELDEEDADFVVKLRSTSSVYKFFKNPHRISYEEHNEWFKNNYLNNGNRIDWIGIDSNGKKVGVFGVFRANAKSIQAEISYIISPDYYGKGFGAEGVSAVIDYCKNYWNSSLIIAEIHKKNDSSIAFIKKLGFDVKQINGNFIIFQKNI